MSLALLSLMTNAAPGQLAGTVPPPSHEAAVESLYRGDYRRAERGFRGDLRGAIKTVQSRWVDSICFNAMLGETYYQMGRNADALQHFDQACQLFLAYPDWLLQVRFTQPPRPDPSPARRRPPWGSGARQVTYASLPDTMLISQGRIDNTLQAERGGVVRSPQFWKVDVVEILRCTALAIRRRSELLGPLAQSDRVSKEIVDTLARGGLAPAGHWSNSWVDLLAGLALSGVGKDQQALPHLNRAVLLDGQFDHDLTGAALLAQAEFASRIGDFRSAAVLYAEAAVAAFAYGDLGVLTEALHAGYVNHVAAGAPGGYPSLADALAWADRKNLDHISWRLRHAMVEQQIDAGQSDAAEKLLASNLSRQRDLSAGRLGVERQWLAARILLLQGERAKGTEALHTALAGTAQVALANFQTLLTNARFDAGALSPRLAVNIYGKLLADPAPRAWSTAPAEALANLRTNHDAALDRWFLASLGRREVLSALEISDLAKRRQFFRELPLGGRLVALRWLLESPVEILDKEQLLERQALLAKMPAYEQLAANGAEIRRTVGDVDPLVVDDRLAQQVEAPLEAWGRLAKQQEALLLRVGLSRIPTSLGFPPQRTPAETKKLMSEGEALLVFHRAGGALHGFVLVPDGEHTWPLPKTRDVTTAVATALREIGNFNASRTLPFEEATGDAWRRVMEQLGQALLGDSRLDLKSVKSLTIVPDGPLWHAPFEALRLAQGGNATPLIDAAPLRYAPTMGLAFGDERPLPPVKRTGLVLSRPTGSSSEREAIEDAQGDLLASLPGAIVAPSSTPVASPLVLACFDQLVVGVEIDLTEQGAEQGPDDWSPAPLDRTAARGSLAAWMALPAAAPERLVLEASRTAAESSLKAGRRSSAAEGDRRGDELFHAACGLMASGPRTVLLSRWTTGGAIHSELIREFAAQMANLPAGDAWRRSVLLTRESDLQPHLEPRLGWSEKDGPPPPAQHPFFWSGYLLIDTGTDPRPKSEEPPPAEEDGAPPVAGEQQAQAAAVEEAPVNP